MVAARSTFRQTGIDFSRLELVISDNDQVPSAEPLAQTLAREAPFPVHYVHEPAAGVSNARNAAMTKVSGDLIAFVDDDNEAAPGWLAALLDAQERFGADAVFGPVQARVPDGLGDHGAYLQWFFSCVGPTEGGVIDGYYGCRGSLVRRQAMPCPERPFSDSRNWSGGEDDLLFDSMMRAGARFAWAPDAVVFEDPAPERIKLSYALARAFGYGQGPTQSCAAASPPDPLGVARWMSVGVAQTFVFGLWAAGKWLIRAPDRALALDRAVRGLGKTFWWGPFRLKFYGRTAAKAK
jgi:glycosyltransferase involved in cell wall biosynthesis